jgi:hypothetical protein
MSLFMNSLVTAFSALSITDASGNVLGQDASDGYFTIQPEGTDTFLFSIRC